MISLHVQLYTNQHTNQHCTCTAKEKKNTLSSRQNLPGPLPQHCSSLISKSNLPLTLSHRITIESNIKVMRIKTMIINLTLYTLKSVCIFSIQLFIYFLRCWQGEFVYQSKVSFDGDHFLYSHDLNMWFRGDIVRRNLMQVTRTV